MPYIGQQPAPKVVTSSDLADDVVTADKIGEFTATENIDIGGYDLRAQTLTADGLTATKSHKKRLCLDGREWVDYCLKEVGKPIGNWVYHKNKLSIKWLKHLGFTVEGPQPYGHAGALFCQFWRAK